MPKTIKQQENKAFLHCLALSGLFAKDLWKLKTYYCGNFQSAWEASGEALAHIIGQDKSKIVTEKRKSVIPEQESYRLEQKGVRICGLDDQEYPYLLKQISDPPLLLYYKGSLKVQFGIGVVGSRGMSEYGFQAVSSIISDFVQLPVDIISGLAYGVDAAAHKIAVENSVNTLAVLGSGIDDDSLYPRENLGLAREIISAGGAIISEFPPGAQAQAFHFPMRNRLISGLSRAVIVVEAKKKSGALLTAHEALEQNRDVYAVPGSIFTENSEGTNSLIKAGAKPLCSGSDLINDYPELKARFDKIDDREKSSLIYNKLPENERIIMEKMDKEGSSPNMLCASTGMRISDVLAALGMLEIKELVINRDNGFYIPNLTKIKKGS